MFHSGILALYFLQTLFMGVIIVFKMWSYQGFWSCTMISNQETQGTADAGMLSKTQSAGVTQRVKKCLWTEWIGDILACYT